MSNARNISKKDIINKRIDFIRRFILCGLPKKSILIKGKELDEQAINKNPSYHPLFNIGIKQYCRNYISAWEIIKEMSNKNKVEELTKSIARYNDLYYNAYTKGNYRLCLFINERIVDLFDLKTVFNNETATISNDNSTIIDLSPEAMELQKKLYECIIKDRATKSNANANI